MSFRYINFFIAVLLLLSVVCVNSEFIELTKKLSEHKKLFEDGLKKPCNQRTFFEEKQYKRAIEGCDDKSILQAVVLNLREKNVKESLIYHPMNIASFIYYEYFSYPFYHNRGDYKQLDAQIDKMHYILDNVDYNFFIDDHAFLSDVRSIPYYCKEFIGTYKNELIDDYPSYQ